MIRKQKNEDIGSIMNIWLDSNIKSHDFIQKDYWIENYETVKQAISESEVYVCESEGRIVAFVGIDHGYIAGIFVEETMRSKGIGTRLMEKCKQLYPSLQLHVYAKNRRAVDFYLREGFAVVDEKTDNHTGETEYRMQWRTGTHHFVTA